MKSRTEFPFSPDRSTVGRLSMASFYESTPALFRLLVEHYGMPDQICPLQPAALRLCGPMALTVDEAMHHVDLPQRERALDLGCAVGASTFRLRRYFSHVTGIDRSYSLLNAARALQREREVSVTWKENGFAPRTCRVRLRADAIVGGIEFRQSDVYNLPADLGVFDLVFMEKLLECLPDPERCLRQVSQLVSTGGYFVHTSSYWWMPDATPVEKQLGTPSQSFAQLGELLAPHFTLEHRLKTPFLIESDATWFYFGMAETLLWKRR